MGLDVSNKRRTKIANHFNSFFTSIGKKISNEVLNVAKKPEDYINYGRDIPELLLGNTTPEHVLKTIKKFKLKTVATYMEFPQKWSNLLVRK